MWVWLGSLVSQRTVLVSSRVCGVYDQGINFIGDHCVYDQHIWLLGDEWTQCLVDDQYINLIWASYSPGQVDEHLKHWSWGLSRKCKVCDQGINLMVGSLCQ